MNREIWTEKITEKNCPSWTCPTCGKGITKLIPKSLLFQETARSKKAGDHPAWDPDWLSYVFTAWAKCEHSPCGEAFAISGQGSVEPCLGEEGETDYETVYSPVSIVPMPRIIQIPADCPADITEELQSSFTLFYSNSAACAGRIRAAVEGLMDYARVPRRKKNKHGKFISITLHARIEEFIKSEPKSGKNLMAIKWLGNSGSHHEVEVPESDLLDAYEIMEHALSEIVANHSKRVAILAKKLTKKHGH